jgi:hypothetical protein
MRLPLARLFLIAAALATSAGFVGTPSASAAGTFTIVDSLGAATPTTTFSVFGSSGLSVLPGQIVGPEFTLSKDTVVTEIGAFIDMRSQPAQLQIWAAQSTGLTGPLATFPLSNDGDFFTVSYESANPHLVLQSGTYFAFFAPQAGDDGFLLGSASIPFNYVAGFTTIGVLGGDVFDTQAAVRILGEPATAHDLLVSLLAKVDAESLGPGTSLHSELVAALAQADAGKTIAACNTMNAFVNAVKAQSGTSLTLEQANGLIVDAQNIEELLGC